MGYFFLICFIIVGFWVILKLLKKKDLNNSGNHNISIENPLWISAEPQKIAKEFHIKQRLFSKSEQALFYEIKKQLPHGYYVFPNMRMADILITTKGEGYKRRVYKILPKHIDFVIANEYFKPVLAIELNGASHNSYKQKQIDIVKNEIFNNAGLPIHTIRVGEVYAEIIPRLFSTLVPKA